MKTRFFLAVVVLFGVGASVRAEVATLIHEEQRIGAELQARLQSMADRLAGRGRATVSAQVQLELLPKVEAYLDRQMLPPAPAAAAAPAAPAAPPPAVFILPGFKDKPRPAEAPASAALRDEAPRKDVSAELALAVGLQVRRILVNILLDRSLPASLEKDLASALAEAIGADRQRGDAVTVTRVGVPEPYRELLRDPAAWLAPAAKLILAAVAFLGLLLTLLMVDRWSRMARLGLGGVAESLTGLARARSAALEGGVPAPAAAAPALGAPASALGVDARPDAGGIRDVVFDISPDQAPRLCYLLKNEDPANIALILPFLKPEVHRAMLESLPREVAAKAMLASAPVRYVDPEMVQTLKTELERRVHGVVGGIHTVVDLLRRAGSGQRDGLLRELEALDPATAARIREWILLFEDLWLLPEEDLGTLFEAADIGVLTLVAAGEGPQTRGRLLGFLTGKVLKAVEQGVRLAGEPDPAKVDSARHALLQTAEKLIDEGRLKRPVKALSAPGGAS